MGEQTKPADSSAPVSPDVAKPVKFLHRKGAQYQIFHGDGVWGAVNNLGNIQVDFYVERPIIPSTVIHQVNPNGDFTGEQVSEGEFDPNHFVVVREFQAGIILSLASAIQVHAVL